MIAKIFSRFKILQLYENLLIAASQFRLKGREANIA